MSSDLDIVESRANGSSFAGIQKSSYNAVIKIEVMYTYDVRLFVRLTLPIRRLINAFEQRLIFSRHFFSPAVRFFAWNVETYFSHSLFLRHRGVNTDKYFYRIAVGIKVRDFAQAGFCVPSLFPPPELRTKAHGWFNNGSFRSPARVPAGVRFFDCFLRFTRILLKVLIIINTCIPSRRI